MLPTYQYIKNKMLKMLPNILKINILLNSTKMTKKKNIYMISLIHSNACRISGAVAESCKPKAWGLKPKDCQVQGQPGQ